MIACAPMAVATSSNVLAYWPPPSWITKPHPDDEPIVNDGCMSANYCDVATRTCKKALPLGAKCTLQTFGVEDEPCFLSKCNATTKRCASECK